MKSSYPLWKLNRKCLVLCEQQKMTLQSQVMQQQQYQQLLKQCQRIIHQQQQHNTSSISNKIKILTIYNYRNNSSNNSNEVIAINKTISQRTETS